MSRTEPTILDEVRPTLALAGPVVLGQVGVMLMGIVDTIMVGPIGKEAVAAAGLGSSINGAVVVLGMGLLLSLDRVVSVAFGARRLGDCQRALVQGIVLATLASVPLTAILLLISTQLRRFGVDPIIERGAAPYLRVLAWSVWPTLLFTTLRATLQAMGDVKFASILLLSANVLNAAGNWLLIFGWHEIPALGVTGSAYATLLSRVTMLLFIAGYAAYRGIADEPIRWRPDFRMMRELLKLGLPASAQIGLEVGVFALATVVAANERFGPAASAAHNIALQIASFTFMVPLGTSSAGAVRVGQAIGRGDVDGARRAGWCAVAIGVGFMACSGILLLTDAGPILGLFTADTLTVALGTKLLMCTSVFQIADGAQVTLAGVLRGIGNTIAPMIANGIGHWGIGLPIGLWLAFPGRMGVLGLWIGLASGLGSVALALLFIWYRGTRHIVVPQAVPA